MLFIVKLLNLTVTAGTINGLIFYSNIVHAFRSALLPVKQPTFATVFISWLNFELGIDTCFFDGMDAYSKVWIEFLFPVYVIVLNILIVHCTTQCSTRFHRLNSNPEPLLATMIFLSFISLLKPASKAISFVLVTYPDGSTETLWLPDANISFFELKHLFMFIVGIAIFFLGFTYSFILLAWHLFDNSPFCMRLSHFLPRTSPRVYLYYHAPYTNKFQFWSGFLLLMRIILLLISVLSTGFGGDSQVSVVAIIIVTGLLILIRTLIKEKSLYRRPCIDYLEMAYYFNLVTLAALTLHTQTSLANILVSVAFVLFIIILIAHIGMKLVK